MSDDLSLFDYVPPKPPVDLARDFERGMEESQRSANAKWTDDEIATVRKAIRTVAGRLHTFTTDAVWDELGADFPFSKGMASQLLAIVHEGIIINTGRVDVSRRGGKHGHAQRLSVWQSTLK